MGAARAERRRVLAGTVSLRVSRGSPAPHVVQVRMKGRKKTGCDWFDQKVLVRDGTAALRLPIASNEDAGEYVVDIRDIPTGTETRATFDVK